MMASEWSLKVMLEDERQRLSATWTACSAAAVAYAPDWHTRVEWSNASYSYTATC